MKPVADTSRVCLGVIVGAQGIRGEVRIKPFTAEPEDVGAYGPVTDEPGEKTLRLSVRGRAKGGGGGRASTASRTATRRRP